MIIGVAIILITALFFSKKNSSSQEGKVNYIDSIENLADRYFNSSSSFDSALYYYTLILSETDNGKLPDQFVIQRVKAMHKIGYIYSYFDFDYKQSVSFLNEALNIALKNNLDYQASLIYRDLAGITFTQAQTLSDTALLNRAFEQYILAIKTLPPDVNTDEKNSILINLLNIANDSVSLNQLLPFIVSKNENLDSTNYLTPYLKYMKEGTVSFINKDYDKANLAFTNMYIVSKNLPHNERFMLQALSKLYNIANIQGKKDKEIIILKEMDSISQASKLLDVYTDVLKVMADYYNKYGSKALGDEYALKYYITKDSLIHRRYLDQVEKTKQGIKAAELTKDLELISYKRRQEKTFLILSLIISLILMAGVILLIKRNRQLQYKNKKLFDNLRLDNGKGRFSYSSETPLKSEKIHFFKNEIEKISISENQEMDKEKYKTSDLDEESKRQIVIEINKIMNNSPLVFESGFTVQRLSELTGLKYRHVSQVINETMGHSFSSLLSEVRIREACRRLDGNNGEYKNFTIEGIGLSVGFKSRSNFIANFKQVTGMTPNEFRKMALKK